MKRSGSGRSTDADKVPVSASKKSLSAGPGPAPRIDPAQAVQKMAAPAAPGRTDATQILSLQRAAGNRAVNRLLTQRTIQAKLTVGAAGDAFEQEADRVARQVVSTPASVQPQDYYAGEVYPEAGKAGFVSRSPIARRRTAAEAEEVPAAGRGEQSGGDFEAGADFEARLSAARGGGAPLSDATREFMEQRMAADFSGVKVHQDAQADRLNRDINATAFTAGQDVFFRQGAYAPESSGGRELIAHELTHVVQQNGDAFKRKPQRADGPGISPDAMANNPALDVDPLYDSTQVVRRHAADYVTLIEDDERIQRKSNAEDRKVAEKNVARAKTSAAAKKKGTLLHNMGKAFSKGGLTTTVDDLEKAAAQYASGENISVDIQTAKEVSLLELQAFLAHEVSHYQAKETGINSTGLVDELQAYRKQYQIQHPDWDEPKIIDAAIGTVGGRQKNGTLNYAWWTAEHAWRAELIRGGFEEPVSFNEKGNWKVSRLMALMQNAENADASDVIAFVTRAKGKWKQEARESKLGGRYALPYGNYALEARNAIWNALEGKGEAPSEAEITGYDKAIVRKIEDAKLKGSTSAGGGTEKWKSEDVKAKWLQKIGDALIQPDLSSELRQQLLQLKQSGEDQVAKK